jgi:hypothetical protein
VPVIHFNTEKPFAPLAVSEKLAIQSFATLARIPEVTAQKIPRGRYNSNCTNDIAFSQPVVEYLLISECISSIVIVIGGSPMP